MVSPSDATVGYLQSPFLEIKGVAFDMQKASNNDIKKKDLLGD
jgi:hypothetical protein